MGNKKAKPSSWAAQSGRLLSLSAAIERQINDMIKMQNARQASGVKGDVRDILAGDAVAYLQQAALALSVAFQRADAVRAIEQAEESGTRAKAVQEAADKVGIALRGAGYRKVT